MLLKFHPHCLGCIKWKKWKKVSSIRSAVRRFRSFCMFLSLKVAFLAISDFYSISLRVPSDIQSTLIISKSKGRYEILRDIRTSTYQICRIEEKIIRITKFNKYICNWTLEVRDILKILWKRGEIAPFPQYFLPVLRFSCLGRDQNFTSR